MPAFYDSKLFIIDKTTNGFMEICDYNADANKIESIKAGKTELTYFSDKSNYTA